LSSSPVSQSSQHRRIAITKKTSTDSVSGAVEQRNQHQQSESGLHIRAAANHQNDEPVITPAAELPSSSSSPPLQIAVLVMGTETYTLAADNGNIIFGSATLVAGAAAQTIDGQSVSLGPDGVVIDGTSTFPLSGVAVNTAAAAVAENPIVQGAIVTAGNLSFTYTAGAPDLDLGSTMLRPGGSEATVQGVAISIGEAGLFVDGRQVPLTGLGHASTNANASGGAATHSSSVVGFDSATLTRSHGGSATSSVAEAAFIQFSDASETASSAKSGATQMAEFSNDGSVLESGYVGVFAAVMLTGVFTLLLL
jgi:hypothetical protein